MNATERERLTRIETILEEKVVGQIEELRGDVKAIRSDLEADKADLAQLKNQGRGVLVGVGLFSSSIGAIVAKFWHHIFN